MHESASSQRTAAEAVRPGDSREWGHIRGGGGGTERKPLIVVLTMEEQAPFGYQEVSWFPRKTKSRRNISGMEEKSEVPILGGKGGGEETQIGKLFSRAGPFSSSLQEKSFRATQDRP